jgi:hypothetical protein
LDREKHSLESFIATVIASMIATAFILVKSIVNPIIYAVRIPEIKEQLLRSSTITNCVAGCSSSSRSTDIRNGCAAMDTQQTNGYPLTRKLPPPVDNTIADMTAVKESPMMAVDRDAETRPLVKKDSCTDGFTQLKGNSDSNLIEIISEVHFV